MKALQSLRERLATRPALLGLLQTQYNPSIAELAGICGYDFLVLDGEHGVYSERDYLHTLQALSGVDILSMVRLPGHDAHALGRYLDFGADAILVPSVSTAEQARALARATVYPPMGTRGVGAPLHRGTRYGQDMAAHMKSPRQHASLIVLIESALGVSNAEEIAAVDGVDGLFIGPADLSANLGCFGDFSQPVYTQAFERVEQAALRNDKLLGTAPHRGYSLETLMARGHRLLLLGADMLLIREAMTAQLKQARALSSKQPDSKTEKSSYP